MPAEVDTPPCPHLQIDLLGQLALSRSSQTLLLPASKKTRALLAYLVVTASRHPRGALCDLFWEEATDPRAGLRWSLTQIRRALGKEQGEALRADREAVEWLGAGVTTDLSRLERLTQHGCAQASLADLTEARALFRGGFLEGLDLASCYAYHEWCIAERERTSRLHEQILVALIERHRGDPEQVLVHARALASHNPLNALGHSELVATLGVLGRRRDAMAQYEQCRRIFERELGLAPPAAVETARAGLATRRGADAHADPVKSVSRFTPNTATPVRAELAGRDMVVAQIGKTIDLAIRGQESEVLLFSGVPGIGKSRLLDEFERQVASAGGRSLRGRAYEAEKVRPFGFWIDALRGLPDDALPVAMRSALQALIRPVAGAPLAPDRDALFDAVVAAVSQLARAGPVAVLVDDLHWIEASSAALLHYALRQLAGAPVLFALAGRSGELEDNAAAQHLVVALARSKRLRRIALGPLSDADARVLLAGMCPGCEPEPVVAQAQGNPLLLLELASADGADSGSTGLLDRVFELRMAPLSPGAGELLDWASALGKAFSLQVLQEAQGVGPGVLDQQLAELERHDLIGAHGDAGYVFGHDLIQQAVYSRISQPRRRLIHGSIARSLSQGMDSSPQICSELAYHAGLGGQHQLAAKASIGAGEYGLRMFANREAAEMARRGLRQAVRIADRAARAGLVMGLLRVQVLATSGLQLARLRPDAATLQHAIDDALAVRQHAQVAQGYYLQSVLYQEAGQFDAAQQATLRAAGAADVSDAMGRARQLANSARCLVELGRDVPRARALVSEAQALSEAAGLHEIEVRWCNGLLHQWDGDLAQAASEIDAALVLAIEAQDRWRQCKCLASLALIELERGRPRQAQVHAAELLLAARQLGEAVDEPLAQAIDALARQMAGEQGARPDAAIERLRLADDKSRLACILNLAATMALGQERFEHARVMATDALAVADSIGDGNESIVAQAMLLRIAEALRQTDSTRQAQDRLRDMLAAPGERSARATQAAVAASPGIAPVRMAETRPAP